MRVPRHNSPEAEQMRRDVGILAGTIGEPNVSTYPNLLEAGGGVASQTRGSRLRVPRHIGIIPDGNRRWAVQRGLQAAAGYAAGVPPGLRLLEACRKLGVREVMRGGEPVAGLSNGATGGSAAVVWTTGCHAGRVAQVNSLLAINLLTRF